MDEEDDKRTEEQADADWRQVTESIFGVNPRKGKQRESYEDLNFRPNWGNTGISKEMWDEEKRNADEWKTRRGDKERIAGDHL